MPGKHPKIRLDRLVVDRGLADSRTRAQALILAGSVVVDDHVIDKPGTQVREDAEVRLKSGAREVLPYASRGGLKLKGALDTFTDLNVRDRVAMDVGASTGGFTDCLLQEGVRKVYAVDVGYGQLVWRLASDERVVVLDRQNIRTMDPARVEDTVELVVADCSFISLVKVLEALPRYLRGPADVVALVKPQFEVGPEGVGKGGIVRDAALREAALERVVSAAGQLGFRHRARRESPITGREGNVEYLVWLSWPG